MHHKLLNTIPPVCEPKSAIARFYLQMGDVAGQYLH